MASNKKYSVIEQLNFLKATYKGSRGTTQRGSLTWFFDIQPLSISGTYRLKIKYKIGFYPQVYIVYPKPLTLANGASILPHTYDTKTQKLCLFHPKYNEWNSSMRIDETIVHWAAQWIVYYESWVITGIWQGGGHGDWDAPKNIPSKCN